MTVASKSECEATADLPLNCITLIGHQEAIPLVAKQSNYTVVYEKVCSLDILKQFFGPFMALFLIRTVKTDTKVEERKKGKTCGKVLQFPGCPFSAVYGIWSPVHSSELNQPPLISHYCMHWAWPQSMSLSHPSLSPKILGDKTK